MVCVCGINDTIFLLRGSVFSALQLYKAHLQDLCLLHTEKRSKRRPEPPGIICHLYAIFFDLSIKSDFRPNLSPSLKSYEELVTDSPFPSQSDLRKWNGSEYL